MRAFIAVTFAVCLAFPSGASWADEDSAEVPLDPASIEQSIASLTEADTSSNRPFELADHISRLHDPAMQERLQGLLNDRMGVLFTQASTGDPSNVPDMPPEASMGQDAAMGTGDLAMAVEQLILGPEATADDLRARDELVGRIAQLQNPDERNALLNRVSAREQEAESVPPMEAGIEPELPMVDEAVQ